MNGSEIEGKVIHLMVAPPKIAPIERNRVGVDTFRSLLLILWKGLDRDGAQIRDSMKRIE